MKSKLALILIFLFLPVVSHAGEKEDLAIELMNLTDAEKMVDQIKSQVVQMQNQLMGQYDIPEEHKKDALDLQKKIMDMIFSEFDWDSMKDDFIKIYTEVYSEKELKALVDFFKSSAGQSMIKKQPILIQKSIATTQSKMKNLLPKLEQMTADFKNSIKEK